MIRIPQLKLKPEHSETALKKAILNELRILETQLISYKIAKQSIDARKKPDIFYIYAVDVEVREEEALLKRRWKNPLTKSKSNTYILPVSGKATLTDRPVIAGMGPAGLFCGLLLAQMGYAPLILERGEAMDERRETVASFWENGILNTESNVQFGEGGAGTFSDGKLNTLVKDENGRGRFVLDTFVNAGADKDILYVNKPHIGTDVLSEVIKKIRQEIIQLGGEVRFESKVTDISVEGGQLKAVQVNDKDWIAATVFVLAIGHSARDTFQMLTKKPLILKPKSFAVGVRVEHAQDMIDFNQYGRPDKGVLPVADYKLSKKLENGRGVYTFCMCPGGYVVNASSEKGRLAVNGMSDRKRDGKNANSALVVSVTPEDFGETDALSGMYFQQRLEEAAFEAGNGAVPVQLFEDFCKGTVSKRLGDVIPSVKGAYSFGNLRSIFPKEVANSIEEGMIAFDKMIPGFAGKDAVLSGVESRTSSPVRIERNERLESAIQGLYPCGEGAGYAGGIMSAAMDGIRVAERIVIGYQVPKL